MSLSQESADACWDNIWVHSKDHTILRGKHSSKVTQNQILAAIPFIRSADLHSQGNSFSILLFPEKAEAQTKYQGGYFLIPQSFCTLLKRSAILFECRKHISLHNAWKPFSCWHSSFVLSALNTTPDPGSHHLYPLSTSIRWMWLGFYCLIFK